MFQGEEFYDFSSFGSLQKCVLFCCLASICCSRFSKLIFFPQMQLQFDPCRRHKISDGPTAHNSLYILKKKIFLCGHDPFHWIQITFSTGHSSLKSAALVVLWSRVSHVFGQSSVDDKSKIDSYCHGKWNADPVCCYQSLSWDGGLQVPHSRPLQCSIKYLPKKCICQTQCPMIIFEKKI